LGAFAHNGMAETLLDASHGSFGVTPSAAGELVGGLSAETRAPVTETCPDGFRPHAAPPYEP
jgi:hypothetical protein